MCNYLCVSLCPSVQWPLCMIVRWHVCSTIRPYFLYHLSFGLGQNFYNIRRKKEKTTNNPTKYICVFSLYLYLVDTRTLFVFPCRRCFSSVLSFSLRNDYYCKTHASSHTTSEEFAISSSSSLLKWTHITEWKKVMSKPKPHKIRKKFTYSTQSFLILDGLQ